MALTLGLAALILGLVVVGLRAAAGPSPSTEAIEVPARPGMPTSPPTSSGPPTTGPGGASPSTAVPPTGAGGTGTSIPKIDTETPRVRVSDLDGRFEVTVPRTWLNLPTLQPDENQWVPIVQRPGGEVEQSELTFAVRWAAADGCTLDRCAADVLARMRTNFPSVNPVTSPDTVGGLPALRIEVSTPDERLVAWVVVKGDRYWVPQLRGPIADFEAVLAVVRPVVTSMSFP